MCYQGFRTYIQLKHCTNSTKLLDAIFHVQRKLWCTEEILTDVFRCIRIACLTRFAAEPEQVFCWGKDANWKYKNTDLAMYAAPGAFPADLRKSPLWTGDLCGECLVDLREQFGHLMQAWLQSSL